MRRAEFINQWKKRVAMGGGIFLCLMVFLFFSFLRPSGRRLSSSGDRLRDAEIRLADYKALSEKITEYRPMREEIEETIDRVNSYLFRGEAAEQQIYTRINSIAADSGVRVGRLSSIGTDSSTLTERRLWEVRFDAGYKNLVTFLRNIERARMFMGVQAIRVRTGRDLQNHSVAITLYTVTAPVGDASEYMNVSGTTEIARLPVETLSSLEDMLSTFKDEALEIEIDRDPFTPQEDIPVEVEEAPPAPTEPRPPRLILEGIAWQTDNPMAIVNGELLQIGDMVADAQLMNITRNTVRFRWRGRNINLSMDE